MKAMKKQPGITAQMALWLAQGERGASSNAIFTHLAGMRANQEYQSNKSHPLDPDDLRRCLLLLEAVPKFKKQINKMASLSPKWAKLVARWYEIEKTFTDEVLAQGMDWKNPKHYWSCPKTYALMGSVLGV